MRLKGLVAYVALAAFWAVFFIGFSWATSLLGPGLSTAIFAAAVGLSLWAFARLVGRRLTWRLQATAVLGAGGLTALVLLTLSTAASLAGASITAIVVSTIPLFATVVAQMRGLERVTGLGAISLLLGILGLMLVAGFRGGDAGWGFLGGVVAALGTAIAAGAAGQHVIGQLHRPRAVEVAVSAAGIAAVCAVALIPLAPPVGIDPLAVLILAILGVACGFLALFALSSASQTVPTRTAATLPGVGTVLAAAGGVILLGESVSVAQVFGMMLILCGTALLRGLVPGWFPASWRS